LRFYNTVVGTGRGGCSAGVDSFAIGTNLEVWPCQSWCDREPIGCFDENIKETLKTSAGNEYFRNRRMMPDCSDCPVLGYCRGGCRATHESEEINGAVCQIRRDILGKLARGYYTNNRQNSGQARNCKCSSGRHDEGVGKILEDYAQKLPDAKEVMLVDTPSLD